MQMLGVDIGGSGIKGCLVDTETGELIGERHRIATPQPATPAAIAHTLKALVEHFDWKGPVGCGFPATIHNGIAKSAANIDKSWIETDAEHLFADVTGKPCYVLNDADAAGLAEMRFGAGKDRKGVIILITVGTGIGTAVFVNGHLLPNTELGHLMLEGMIAEHYCSDAVRKLRGSLLGALGQTLQQISGSPRVSLLPRPLHSGRRQRSQTGEVRRSHRNPGAAHSRSQSQPGRNYRRSALRR